MSPLKLGNKIIDKNSLYFIADIGANHDGSLNRAIDLIHMCKEAGADAAKFQNFQVDKIVSRKGFESMQSKSSHQSSWKKSVYDTYKGASINKEWTKTLKEECDKIGIDYFTSPYDFESVDLVDQYVDLYKIGSGDITWINLVDYIFSKNKPVIIATGASDLTDVERIMSLAQTKTNNTVLMQCNTNYTANKENFKYINLNVLKIFSKMYPGTMLGLSDHTLGHSTVLGSIALGARVIEKHFTDDNKREGPDNAFAMNPNTWNEMVDRSYEILYALGDGVKRVEENEMETINLQRRCLRFKSDMKVGEIIRNEDLIALRPISPLGVQPYDIDKVIGKKLKYDVFEGTHITLNMV
jgi:sialic acid synthase SpsE